MPVKREEIPLKLQLYLWCSPLLDFELRCLPRAGGFYDQYMEDIIWFSMIEEKLKEVRGRQLEQQRRNANRT